MRFFKKEQLGFSEEQDAEYEHLESELERLRNAEHVKLIKEASERERQRIAAEEEAKRQAERSRIWTAKCESDRRVSACRVDNWQWNEDEFIARLPDVWRPFSFLGIAYANPTQNQAAMPTEFFNTRTGHWDKQSHPSSRTIYLNAVTSGRNFAMLYAGAYRLEGTSAGDLVKFAADEKGKVLFLSNPARMFETYSQQEARSGNSFAMFLPEIMEDVSIMEFQKKVELFKPSLEVLYNQAIQGLHLGDGWA